MKSKSQANKKNNILILDGGGSSLKAFVQTESSLKLKVKYKGNFNVQTGQRDKILNTISLMIKQFPSEYVKIGLAGLVEKKDASWLVKEFIGKKISVMSDVDLAIDIHFQGGDGMLAILGTGSIFAAKAGQKKVKIGGYGSAIGDVGSGYAIGQEAVRTYLQLLDGFAKDAIFEAAMKKFFRTKADAVRKIYHEHFELQHLAPVVFMCAAQESAVAMKIIDYQTSLVVRYIEHLRRRIGRNLPLCLVGGLTEHKTQYVERLKEKLKNININLHLGNGES